MGVGLGLAMGFTWYIFFGSGGWFWSVVCFVGWLVGWHHFVFYFLFGWAFRSVGLSVDWLVGWLVVTTLFFLFGWAVWEVGRLVGWSVPLSFSCMGGKFGKLVGWFGWCNSFFGVGGRFGRSVSRLVGWHHVFFLVWVGCSEGRLVGWWVLLCFSLVWVGVLSVGWLVDTTLFFCLDGLFGLVGGLVDWYYSVFFCMGGRFGRSFGRLVGWFVPI